MNVTEGKELVINARAVGEIDSLRANFSEIPGFVCTTSILLCNNTRNFDDGNFNGFNGYQRCVKRAERPDNGRKIKFMVKHSNGTSQVVEVNITGEFLR